MKSTYVIDTQVKGASQIKGLQTGLKGVSAQTNRTASAMARLKTTAGGAMGALKGLLPLIGTAAMGKFVNDTLQAGDRLEKFAQSTGVAVPMLDKLRKSSELAGTNFNTLVKTFPMLARNINETSNGMGKAKDAFEELGISVVNSDGSLRASEQVLLDIADKFKNMEDGTKKASLAYDLFGGKTSEQLIPLLNSGRDAIEGMGTTMTEHGVKRMAAFNDSMSKVKFLFQDMFVTLTTSLLPALEKIVTITTDAVEWFNKLPGPIKTITAAAVALSVPLIALAPVAASLVITFKALAAIKLGAMFMAIIPAIGALMPVIAPFLIGGAVVVGIIGLGKLIGTVAGHVWAARGKIASAIGGILGPIKTLFSWANKAASALAALFRRRSKNKQSNQSSNQERAAEGLYASNPTDALVGEAGGEYVIPSRKAGAFARNYMGGLRGSAAIPRRFAEGGFVPGNANISITTGPVTQMDGQNFVTTQDMARAVQTGVNQTLSMLSGDMDLRQQLGLT